MHDGSIATLPEVIDHYAKGGRQAPAGEGVSSYKDRAIRPITLSEEERADLVAFLESLTDAGIPAALTGARARTRTA